jgi:excisionase family DNA binding protein
MSIDLTTIEFLNTEQLASYLGISKTSVYRLTGYHLISFYKLGHNIRFKKADVLTYLEKNCFRPSS